MSYPEPLPICRILDGVIDIVCLPLFILACLAVLWGVAVLAQTDFHPPEK